jgi:hypothetical protein
MVPLHFEDTWRQRDLGNMGTSSAMDTFLENLTSLDSQVANTLTALEDLPCKGKAVLDFSNHLRDTLLEMPGLDTSDPEIRDALKRLHGLSDLAELWNLWDATLMLLMDKCSELDD